MFMNKISMSETCPYNFSYKKSCQILEQPVATKGIQHNTNFATVHGRVIVGGCSIKFERNFLRQFAHAVARRMQCLSICTTSLQGHMKGFHSEI